MGTESCELCIIGAGYAGVNALHAAARYLEPGSRVVVIDPNNRWGGQWVQQYSFVRLHQPYEQFTAGSRPWDLDKPRSHLASKTEILAHFEHIVSEAVEQRQLDLICLFGYKYTRHAVTEEGARRIVEVCAEPCSGGSEAALPRMTVQASRLIKATGFDIVIKEPMNLTSQRVHSLAPKDVLTPYWNAKMNYSGDCMAPVWVIGSGKTAYDCMYHLQKQLKDAHSRLRCVSGRGVMFMNRDVMFPQGWARISPFSTTGVDHMMDAMTLYDGTNAQQVYSEMTNRRFFHSAVPDPQHFQLGICSEHEISVIKDLLSPPNEKIVKGHLIDVVEHESNLMLKVRMLDAQIKMFPTPPGSFIVNATDNRAFGANAFEPILSSDGLVLAPQKACGFSGPTANHLTHLFYLEKLEPIWRTLPRAEFDFINGKHKMGLEALFAIVISDARVRTLLPLSVALGNKQSPITWFPLHVRIAAFIRVVRNFKTLVQKMNQLSSHRYTDDPSSVIETFEQFMDSKSDHDIVMKSKL